MKIGIEARWLQRETTGFGKYAYNLLRELNDLNHGHQLSVYVNNRSVDRGLFANVRARRIVVPLRPPLYKQVGIPLDIVLKHRQLDLFHFLYNAPALFMPCPFVVTIHDLSYLHVPQMMSWVNRTLAWWQLRFSAAKARLIITDSENSKRDILNRLHIPENKIDVIPLGVEPSFRPISSDQKVALCRKYSIPGPFILYVGTYLPHKNLPTLIRAFGRLVAKGNSSLNLVLAGKKGRNAENIESLVEKLGLNRRVQMPGFVPDEDLPQLYGSCSVFVFPSLYEGFGLPMLEAMACGVPVIAARSSCLMEVGGDAAVYFDPASDEALADALERTLKNDGLRHDAVRQGFVQAAKFTWRRVAERTLRGYERAAELHH